MSTDLLWPPAVRISDLLPPGTRMTDEELIRSPPLCPEFVVEVRSHSDSRRAQEEKMKLWMEHGAKLAC